MAYPYFYNFTYIIIHNEIIWYHPDRGFDQYSHC
jgi:hypothetical protein